MNASFVVNMLIMLNCPYFILLERVGCVCP